MSGYVANPSHSRSHNKMQYLFLNGRHIRDRSLQHALGEAYRGLLLGGRFPICFLRCDLPAELVDVNVHPTKLEVRFQDGGRVYSQLLSMLRSRFLSTDLTARITPPADGSSCDAPLDAFDCDQLTQTRQQVIQWARGSAAGAPPASRPLPPTPPPAVARAPIDRPAVSPTAPAGA